jgi:D-alanyl-D-alanine carboxypeptidase
VADRAAVLNEWVEEVRAATRAPAALVSWRDRRGTLSDVAGDEPVDGALRIASVTKTFVACAALRLVEQDRLALRTPLAEVLGPDSADLLRSGGFEPTVIVVDHLLTHTSGLVDHASLPSYENAVMSEPSRVWTRAEQVRRATEAGPVAAPSTVVSYSDTGYVLLGEVLERATGKDLGAAVRELLDLDGLGLRSTWWEVDEAPRAEVRTRQQVHGQPLELFDPTVDLFGGGGLVSTTGDLARFFEAVVRGEVLGRDATRLLLTVTDLPGERPGMARGIFREEQVAPGWVGHGGFWGVYGGASDQTGQAVGLCLTEHEAMVRFDRAPALADLCRRMADAR